LATASRVEGRPKVVRGGETQSLTAGISLASGDEVAAGETDRLLMQLADRGQILVDFDSKVRLATPPASDGAGAARIQLLEGQLWAWSPGDGQEIQIETGPGVVRVHQGEGLVHTHVAGEEMGAAFRVGVEVSAVRGRVRMDDFLGRSTEIPQNRALYVWKSQNGLETQIRPLARILQKSSGWGRRMEEWVIPPLRRADVLAGFAAPRVCLGVTLMPRVDLAQGMEVRAVEDGSVAEQAGVQSGDILLAAGGRPLSTAADLAAVELELAAADSIELTISRSASRMGLKSSLGRPTELGVSAEVSRILGAASRTAATGDLGSATAQLRGLTDNEPSCGWAWYNLGLLAEYRGESLTALACFKQAENLIPENSAIRTALGRAYGRIGNCARAIGALKQATELGADAKTGFLLGYVDLLAGDAGAARGQAQELFASPDRTDRAHGAALRALAAYAEDDMSQALEDMETALQLDPTHLDLQLDRAKLQLAAGHTRGCFITLSKRAAGSAIYRRSAFCSLLVVLDRALKDQEEVMKQVLMWRERDCEWCCGVIRTQPRHLA
jgi:tetratricopeptide (TPR) repeat protein